METEPTVIISRVIVWVNKCFAGGDVHRVIVWVNKITIFVFIVYVGGYINTHIY